MSASPPSPTGPPTGAVTGTGSNRIIRRTPTGAFPAATGTGIIRRAPTGSFPAATGAAAAVSTGMAPRVDTPVTADAAGTPDGVDRFQPSATIPITACVIAIISGWATAVVATDLVASWWHTDRLFCLAVGFLTLIFAGTTVAGMVLLLRRRWPGGHLIAIGAVVALLTFGSLFLAGARVPTVVHLIPLLQVASAALALHPASRRWVIR